MLWSGFGAAAGRGLTQNAVPKQIAIKMNANPASRNLFFHFTHSLPIKLRLYRIVTIALSLWNVLIY